MSEVAVLAFSGGLDTTYCAVWLREQGYAVHTVAIQTCGFDDDELAAIERRAQEVGAAEHRTFDAQDELFTDYLRYLIFANALRGGVYPLCVSAERVVQAKRVARYAASIHATAIAHGSTGAGNDQVRFDAAFRVLAPEAKILTPIRQQSLSREAETAWLAERGIIIPEKTSKYSINRGLWGATIGGVETHRSDGVLPENVHLLTASSAQWPTEPEAVRVDFERGVPMKLDGVYMDPVRLIDRLNARAARHGVGRGIHVGDTILGIKGRVAFEAPAATVLVGAHRELEKIVLSRQQSFWKPILGDLYGNLLHEARFFDPMMRDIESFLTSTQQYVTGGVMVRLFQGQAAVEGVTSPHSLMDQSTALYGEGSSMWSGDEAAAFSKLYGLQDVLCHRAAETGGVHATLG